MPDLWGSLHWSLIPFVKKYQLKRERGNNGFHVRSELRNSSVFRLLLPWSKKELIHFTFCHLFTYFSLSHSSHRCLSLCYTHMRSVSWICYVWNGMLAFYAVYTVFCFLNGMWSSIQWNDQAVVCYTLYHMHSHTTSNS